MVDRKHYAKTISQQNSRKLKLPPLQSPHTRVCGKRRVFNKINNSLNMKIKLNTNTTTCLKICTEVLTTAFISKVIPPYPKTHYSNNIIRILAIKTQVSYPSKNIQHKHNYIKPTPLIHINHLNSKRITQTKKSQYFSNTSTNKLRTYQNKNSNHIVHTNHRKINQKCISKPTTKYQTQLLSPPILKYGVHFKHKDHIEQTNLRKIKQNYIDTSYTKNYLKTSPHTHVYGMRWTRKNPIKNLDTKTKPKRIVPLNTKTPTKLGISKGNIAYTTIILPNYTHIKTHKKKDKKINTLETTQKLITSLKN